MPVPQTVCAFLLSFVPLAAVVAPLFFHHSPRADLGPYSWSYVAFLAVATVGATCR